MTRGLVVMGGVALVGVLVLGGLAQQFHGRGPRREENTPLEIAGDSPLDELLGRSITIPFVEPTALSDVAAHLAKSLNVRVVLDPGAMARLDLLPEDTIQVQVVGTVRLSTALPLLLDIFEMTYRYVPEDRLLVLTDGRGANDPQRVVLNELRDLHRDVHDLQDAVDEMMTLMGAEARPALRKPTIIEEVVPPPDDEPARPAPASRPG